MRAKASDLTERELLESHAKALEAALESMTDTAVKQDEEIERLTRERDEAQERFEELRDVVYNEANVDRERLRAFVTKLANPDFSRVSSPLGSLHAAGMCAEAESVAKLAKQVLSGEWQPDETSDVPGPQLCTCRDGARYRFIRQGEDRLDTLEEEILAAVWNDIGFKGCWRERMDKRIDEAMQQLKPGAAL